MPKIGKYELPAPVYSTDLYLAAVLRELIALNQALTKAQPAARDSKPTQAGKK